MEKMTTLLSVGRSSWVSRGEEGGREGSSEWPTGAQAGLSVESIGGDNCDHRKSLAAGRY